jgi:hypothetical protein
MNHSSSIIAQNVSNISPSCPRCGRVCDPGVSWPGANYCRGRVLLPFIARQPGITTWGLAQASGLSYQDASRALLKLRDYQLVLTESELRPKGGFRYRYRLSDDQEAFERFLGRPCHD